MLTALGPSGTVTDPFRGGLRGTVQGTVDYTFPRERYAALGADDDTLDELAQVFAGLSYDERADAHEWIESADDETLREQLDAYLSVRDASKVLAALPDDERTVLLNLTPEQRDELAAWSAAVEEAERLSGSQSGGGTGGTPEPENAPETQAEPAAEPSEGGDGDGGAASTEQQPSETVTFSLDDVGATSVNSWKAHVTAGDVSAAELLAAEQARGDDARSSLVDWLTARAS